MTTTYSKISIGCGLWGRVAATLLVAFAITLADVNSAAFAQLPPSSDPAVINEELRRRQEQELRRPSRDDVQDDDAVTSDPFDFEPLDGQGVSFDLNDITFDESTFLDGANLDAIASEYIGRTVTFDDLNALVARVNALYDERGYVSARAVLAPQRIEGGVIHITLVEGRIGDVTFGGVAYYRDNYVGRRVKLSRDDVLNVPNLERQILRFNRLNDAQLHASLQPGASFGTTDITLTLNEPKRNQLDIFFDNNGFDSTGEYEAGFIGRRHGLVTGADRVSVFFVGAEGSLSGSAAYNTPIGRHGTRIGVSYVRGRTNVIDGPFEDANVDGNSNSIAVNASHPLYYRGGLLVNALVNGQRTDATTEVDNIEISDTLVYQVDGGFSADYLGADQIAVLQFSTLYANAEERLFDDTRNLILLRGSAFYVRNLPWDLRANVQSQWQVAFEDDLPGTLEFQIGGANSVRAFDPGTAAGDTGYYGSFEVARDLWSKGRNSIEAYVFFDRGQVFSLFPTQTISAAGVGANLAHGRRIRLSATIGVPLEEDGIVEQDSVRVFFNLSFKAF